MRDVEEIASIAVDCGLRLHRELGPGLLESVYERVLAAKLQRQGLHVGRQLPISIKVEDMEFVDAFRVDLIIDDQLVIEIKSVEAMRKVHGKQLLTYLRLLNKPLGFLMNFGASTFREGCHRVVNNHNNFASSRLRVNQIKPPISSQNPDWDGYFAKGPHPDFPTLEDIRSDKYKP